MRILRYRLLDMQVLHPITEDMKMLTTIRLPNKGRKRSIDKQGRVQTDANMGLSTGIIYCEFWGVVWSIESAGVLFVQFILVWMHCFWNGSEMVCLGVPRGDEFHNK